MEIDGGFYTLQGVEDSEEEKREVRRDRIV